MTDGTLTLDSATALLLIVAGISSWASYAIGKRHGIEQTLARLNRRRGASLVLPKGDGE